MSAIASALVRADEMGGGELCFVPHGGCPTWVAEVEWIPRHGTYISGFFAVRSMDTRTYSFTGQFMSRDGALLSANRRVAAWRSRENRKARQLELLR